MAATFNASFKGIGEMLRADFMVAAMESKAEKVKTRAEQIAPYDAESKDGTHYRDAFHVEADARGGAHHDRAVGRVVNDDEAAFFIEYGNVHVDRHRTLGRALDAAGE
jgi:hypothetical protein